MTLALVVGLVSISFVAAASSQAAPREALGSFGGAGTGAGQLGVGTPDLAVNRTGVGGASEGDVYVVDESNQRVEQFSATGAFVRLFGKEVNETEVLAAAPASAQDVCNAGSGDTCKAGVASGAAGALNSPQGIAIDQSNGNVFVTDSGNRRIDVFSGSGAFEGAFGWGVIANTTAALQFCTRETGCVTGLTGAGGGEFGAQIGRVAVNPVDGHLVVGSKTNVRLDEFAPTMSAETVTGMSFLRALGWAVVSGGPGNTESLNQTQSLTVKASGGTFTLSFAGQTTPPLAFNASPTQIAQALTSLSTVGAPGGRISVTGGPGSIAGSTPFFVHFEAALGGAAADPLLVVDPTGLTGAIHTATVAAVAGPEECEPARGDVCKAGKEGPGIGEFATAGGATLAAVAVDSTGAIYALSGSTGACSASTSVCRVQKFAPTTTFAESGGEFAEAQLRATAGTAKPLQVAVDSADQVYVAKQVSSTEFRILEFEPNGNLVSTSPAGAALAADQGLAAGTEGRLYVATGNGRVTILGPLPPPEAFEPSCATVTATEATCTATVEIPEIESGGVPTTYHFEYSTDGVTWERYPVIEISLGATPGLASDTETIPHLAPNTLYQIRVAATTAGTVTSPAAHLTTLAVGPTIGHTFADPVQQTEATLNAFITPNHLPTSYYFEWGATSTYGYKAPSFARQIGSGSEPIEVSEPISGLEPATTYHFRVIAINSAGTTPGSDLEFATPNDAGLPDGRGYELVSPADKGPVALPGRTLLGGLGFQVAADGQSIGYVMGYGLPDATAGGSLFYVARRDPDGWQSTQLTPPATVPSYRQGGESGAGFYQYLASDLSCGVVRSSQPASVDAPRAAIEAGGEDLFRWSGDGSFTALAPDPSNPAVAGPANPYTIDGASADCLHVVFESLYAYPGVPATGLYEASGGSLRNVAVLPDGTPASSTSVHAGANGNSWRAVSEDGSRVYFTAVSNAGGDTGKSAVFVREDGTRTVDVSQSQTTTSDTEATYQDAAADGSRVFFRANAGLASDSATTLGNSLYEYDLGSGQLVDLSADANGADSQGAKVEGVLDASADGSYVYFAAQGQLVPGQGNTYAENAADGSSNVYLSHAGQLRYVAIVSQADIAAGLLVARSESVNNGWTSRTTPDGQQLLFQSRSDITGYLGGGAPEAYLFSASTGATVCVSCRPDGAPSVGGPSTSPLASGGSIGNAPHPPLTLTDDGRRVFFTSPDVLAAGGVAGEDNVYEWEDGEVYLLGTGGTRIAGGGSSMEFAGASSDGADVFIATDRALSPSDADQRSDVYDIRVGGGLPSPPPPVESCQALSEGSCQGPAASPPAAIGPATPSFSGPGNQATPEPSRTPRRHKHTKRHHHKHRHGHRKHHQGRHAKSDRRNAK